MTCAIHLPPNKPTAYYHLSQPVRHSLPVRILRATRVGQYVLQMTAVKRNRNRMAQVSLILLSLIISAYLGWPYFSTVFGLIAVLIIAKAIIAEWTSIMEKGE